MTDIQNAGPLHIKETGKPAQADTSDGLQLAYVHVLNKTSKTRQSTGCIYDDKMSALETEAREHEEEEISVADGPGTFQVIKHL